MAVSSIAGKITDLPFHDVVLDVLLHSCAPNDGVIYVLLESYVVDVMNRLNRIEHGHPLHRQARGISFSATSHQVYNGILASRSQGVILSNLVWV